MFAFFFLLDSQEVWEMKFLNQHLTWMIKIRPCKEPVNSSLEAVVRVIFFTGVPVIITLCPWKKIACLLTPKQQSAKHKPFRLVFQTSLWPTAFSVIPTLKPKRSACFYYYWNTNHEHSDYLSFYLCFPLCLLQSPDISASSKSTILSVFRGPGHFHSPVYSKPSWGAAATPVLLILCDLAPSPYSDKNPTNK